MKIRLNENEVYEIKLPEEINVNELLMITNRFNILSKQFSRFNSLGSKSQDNLNDKDNKETNRETARQIILGEKEVHSLGLDKKAEWKLLRDNRNIFVELLNTYNKEDKNEFEEVRKKYNLSHIDRMDMHDISIIRLKELHKVKPREVGLIKFPTLQEKVGSLRINNKEEQK